MKEIEKQIKNLKQLFNRQLQIALSNDDLDFIFDIDFKEFPSPFEMTKAQIQDICDYANATYRELGFMYEFDGNNITEQYLALLLLYAKTSEHHNVLDEYSLNINLLGEK